MNCFFSYTIQNWFQEQGRSLPWRQTKDPYKIWISEIILQQTRVVQGWEYYERFVTRFPDVCSLADAPEDEVLRMWQGLGYYSRARNLHAAARMVVESGAFPSTRETLLALPGVGEYTAAAIGSIAYDLPLAVLDGNVYRVLSRYFAIETPIDTTEGCKQFRALADEMLDSNHPGMYNQAIMDFGALQCVPQHPDCAVCPLREGCLAFSQGLVGALPCKSRHTKVRDRYFTYLYLRDTQGRILLQRRGAGDIWQGLYQWPLFESSQPLTLSQVSALCPEARISSMASGITHQLSHQLLHADCYLAEVDVLPDWGVVIPETERSHYAIPRLLEKILCLVEKGDRK